MSFIVCQSSLRKRAFVASLFVFVHLCMLLFVSSLVSLPLSVVGYSVIVALSGHYLF